MVQKNCEIEYDLDSFEIEGTVFKKSKRQRVLVTIPNGVTEIGEEAFRDCYRLETIKIPDSVTQIGALAFLNCYKLRNISIPNYVTSIGDGAFYNCKNLQKITIPSGVNKIGTETFEGCISLVTVNLLDGLNEIGERAFHLCHKLKNIKIPASVTKIGNKAFLQSGLTTLHIPKNVTTIGACAIGVCDDLKLITCEAEEQPSGWSIAWNSFYTWFSEAKIVWSAKENSGKNKSKRNIVK